MDVLKLLKLRKDALIYELNSEKYNKHPEHYRDRILKLNTKLDEIRSLIRIMNNGTIYPL